MRALAVRLHRRPVAAEHREAERPVQPRQITLLEPARLPLVKGKPRLGCPLAGIGKIVCIGLNYTDHAAEVGRSLPQEPTVFLKAPSAISGPHDPM